MTELSNPKTLDDAIEELHRRVEPGAGGSRRHLLAGGLGLATALGSGLASASPSAPGIHAFAPIVGSWFLQVHFLSGPNAGKFEETLACFGAGGVYVESDGLAPQAHFGQWTCNRDGSYDYTLVEFQYDPATGNVAQIVVPQGKIALNGIDALQSVATTVTVYVYDPSSGAQIDRIVIPDVSELRGERLTSTWTPPAVFPL